MIEHIELNIRHHSRPGAPVWYILTNAEGQPLRITPPGYYVAKCLWYEASLFGESRVADVAALVSDQSGEQIKAVTIVSYLDNLRDRLVREERALAGGAIHG
jgi:hypothetical protein